MLSVRIVLPTGFKPAHADTLLRYFRDERSLSAGEWSLVLEATDLLRRAMVIHSGGADTFGSLYNRQVEAVYADKFIEQLLVMDDPAEQSESLRASVARTIVRDLRVTGLFEPAIRETQLLVAFCIFWWQSFTKGYAFEVEVFRDLASSDIRFVAHDLRHRQERFSPYDLTILRWHGDIKTSTYFLSMRRSEALQHDFYITRLYHPSARGWRSVVLLRTAFWRMLDGEPTPTELDRVWQVLPGVAQVWLAAQPFVIVLYETWKERVRQRQEREDE